MEFKPKRWSFFGRVFPDLPPIWLNIPHLQAEVGLGFSFSLEGHIHHSKVIAAVVQQTSIDLFSLRNSVTGALQLHADVLGFRMGAGLEVYLDSAQADDGSWQFFEGYIPALRRDGDFSVSASFLNAVGQDPASHAALADFRAAMHIPLQTGFFCFRAIESAMQSFKQQREKDIVAWDRLRMTLHIDRPAIDRIKAHADWARHGGLGQVTDADRVMLLTTTKAIIERYLEFVVGGRQPLPPDSYAMIA